MIYKATIPQIHCSGCVNSIKLTLEDKFTNIQGDQDNKTITFESSENLEDVKRDVKELLDQLNKEMNSDHGYLFTNIEEVF